MARSALEKKLDEALKILYPHERIRSDWAIKVPPGRTLYVDRLIPGARVAIEADGRQHSTFVKFMHGDADGFKNHQQRDRIKAEWLEAHGYTLVRVAYNEEISAAIIREKILAALTAEEE